MPYYSHAMRGDSMLVIRRERIARCSDHCATDILKRLACAHAAGTRENAGTEAKA
jgi:hypothetical protein